MQQALQTAGQRAGADVTDALWRRVTLGRFIHSEESTVLRLGIDTGGTSTDLALVDDERGVDGQAGEGVA
jgi:activator of 2-hydroxyglutaryl-CoA dehydratase